MSPQNIIRVWASLFLMASAAGPVATKVQAAPPSAQEQGLEISNRRPLLRIPVKSERLTNSPDVLVLAITGVSNTNLQPVTISVYFETTARKWKVGRFSLFPADHPGTFK